VVLDSPQPLLEPPRIHIADGSDGAVRGFEEGLQVGTTSLPSHPDHADADLPARRVGTEKTVRCKKGPSGQESGGSQELASIHKGATHVAAGERNGKTISA
jgi:hypothetical protein